MQDGFSLGEAGMPMLDSAYNFARFLSRDSEAAEQIVHAAYLHAGRDLDANRTSRIQLLKVVRDCYSTRLSASRQSGRQRYQRVEKPLPDAVASFLLRSEDPPGADILVDVDAATIRAAIETLPRKLREILVLKELELLSYKEIAEVTSLQTEEIMSRLACARRMLAGSGGRHACARLPHDPRRR
jgi:DNA-directed RNA polymerase specialized sigma24 family protein